jgi:serine phosphatase RsbU (regulator of sigma subunit)
VDRFAGVAQRGAVGRRVPDSGGQPLGSGSLPANRRRAAPAGNCRGSRRAALAISPPKAALAYPRILRQVQARTVGGDYYDFLDLGAGHLGFVLADVAGKGVAAALLMANLQGNVHNRGGIDPHDLPAMLAALNHHLYEHSEVNRYATLFFGCYDDDARSLAFVNCGHNPPLLLRNHGVVDRLEATATVLGLFGSWQCAVGWTQMETGDLLSIFTDGVTEATASNGDEFGESCLLSILQDSRELSSATILNEVERAVEEFRCGERPQDDLTLVVARAQ